MVVRQGIKLGCYMTKIVWEIGMSVADWADSYTDIIGKTTDNYSDIDLFKKIQQAIK
jgi:hypothetical protein